MNIELKRLDTYDINFDVEFAKLEQDIFNILSNSYRVYYGQEYDKERIQEGKAILYLGFVDGKLVAVTYVKRNLRRGSTAIYPEQYRKLGLAQKLIELSFSDFPKQYSILSTNFEYSHKMLSLLEKVGFKKAITIEEIKSITKDEFKLLSNFREINGYFVFDRISERRNSKREFLTLLHTF